MNMSRRQTKSDVEGICIYQNMEGGRHSSIYIYIWKLIKIVDFMPETIQATIPESSHVQWFFIQQKGHLCWQPCSLDNTLNRSSSAGESFKIKEKLCLFVLGI